MPKVKGKSELCSCVLRYFKSEQGIEEHSLIDRYNALETIVHSKISEKYHHFLAQPIKEDGIILWYASPFIEIPKQLSLLEGEEQIKYKKVLDETLAHYKSVINALRKDDKIIEAEYLEKAIKFVDPNFVYCYDGKTILGIWGMQLRENVREPLGQVVKNLFVEKKSPSEPVSEPVPEAVPSQYYTVTFNAGQSGNLNGNSELSKHYGEIITEYEIPKIDPDTGFEFTGWDMNPKDYCVNGDTIFNAQYRPKVPPITPLPWYKRFWNWLKGLNFGKWLKWLLWLLLLLLLILLFSWLFRRCGSGDAAEIPKPIPFPIVDKPWVYDDPNVGDGRGKYTPGNPYTRIPTPPEYGDVLPPDQGVLPPIDTTNLIRDPGSPVIIGNRLNVLMENEDKSIMDLAKDFKKKYPDDKYEVVYYDDFVKRMQIEVPEEERLKLKSEIPIIFAPDYELFVFDEALFESIYTPNDPALADPDKAWYLKTINAPKAWDITRGSPKLTIAIVDNGFSLKHPELKSKVVMPFNVWLHSTEIFPQEIDHGTHVAGTALAVADNGKGLCGIAPECAFMPVQVANKQDLMTTTSVLDGILYALYQGADVINVSLGMEFTGTLPDYEQRDLQDNHFKEEERLWNEIMKIANKHKAIIVAAAGNENMLAGVNPMNRPKNFIIVSAVDKSNREYCKAGFSNYGDYSTISAPGVDIYSTIGNNGYQVMDGTSMAAPIVAGTVALMKSLNNDLTCEQIICILQGTGKPAEGKIGNLIQIDLALQKVKLGELFDCDNQAKTPSTGDVQVMLSWNNYNDLDLICTDPNNDTVWFKNTNVSSGGKLEIDMNRSYPDSEIPIENIYWPSGGAPKGTYSVFLLYYKQHIVINETPYKIIVKYGGKTKEYIGKIKHEDNTVQICTFTLGDPGNPNDPNLPSPGRSREDLLHERERLQRQLDQIDHELELIRNNVNFQK